MKKKKTKKHNDVVKIFGACKLLGVTLEHSILHRKVEVNLKIA